MTKRKRRDSIDGDGGGNAKAAGPPEPDYRRQRQIAATFEHSAQRLEKAFKLAKAFERQKLGRRQKQHQPGQSQQESRTGKKKKAKKTTPEGDQEESGSDNEHNEEDKGEIARIEAEIAALKMLDTSASARHFLAKSLIKIKAVSSDPNLPIDISSPIPVRALTTNTSSATATSSSSRTFSALPASTALLNVHARLCNSNPVKQAFPTAIADIKHELGLENGVIDGKKPKRLRAKDFAKLVESVPVASHTNRDDDSDIDMNQYAGRLASSGDEDDHRNERSDSDDADGAEASDEDMDSDMDVAQLERQLQQEGLSRRMPDHSLSDSDSEDGTQQALASATKRRTAKASSSAAPVTSSSFVPLLTMGGYISGSGSEIDDQFEAEKPRKNRRGQRARQAIWEKKFGKTAKHLQHQSENATWDPRKGAVSRSTSKFAKDANRLPLGKNRLETRKKVADVPKKAPRRDDSGPLHPSWEAAKKAKEKKSAPVAFQGKKISFD